MKVSYSIKCWEPLKWSKRDLAGWLKDLIMSKINNLYGYREALEAPEFEGIKKYPKPRRAKLTVTYEVEDESDESIFYIDNVSLSISQAVKSQRKDD